jgi:hypothetical protein
MSSSALALSYAAGSLYLCSTSILGWQIAKLWLKHIGYLFFLALYFFIGLLGAVIYLISRNYGNGWIIALALTLISLTISLVLHYRFKLSLLHHLPDGLVITCSVIGLLVSPALIFSTHHYRLLQAEKQGAKALTSQTQQLQSMSNQVQQIGEEISNNPQFHPLLQLSSLDKLRELSQQDMVLHQLDFLTILDHSGTVLVRAHQPSAGGDLYATRFPWIVPTLNGQSVTGLAWNEANRPVILTATPIKNGDVVIGSLITGYLLNDSKLRTPAIALASSSQVLASNNSPVAKFFTTSDFSTHLRQQSFAPKQIIQEEMTTGNSVYMYSSQELATLEPSRPLRILSLTREY